MPSEKILKSKQQYVADLAEQMKGAEAFVFVSARGLTVEQDTKMRAELRGAGVTYQVIKNSMLKRVFEELKIEGLENIFEGPTAVAYSNEVTAPAKILAKYAEDYEPLEIKGGVIGGKAASVAEVIALSKVPDVETLYSQVVYGLLFPFTKLAMLVKAVAEKQNDGAEAPAEAAAEEAPAAEAPAEEAPAEAAAEEAPAEAPAEVAAEAPAEA